jgi:protein MAK11
LLAPALAGMGWSMSDEKLSGESSCVESKLCESNQQFTYTANMAKRKRDAAPAVGAPNGKARKIVEITLPSNTTYIQVITGSYERVLHGIIAAIPSSILRPAETIVKNGTPLPETEPEEEELPEVKFLDSFLFNAHTSAIRCLALSPIPKDFDASTRVILASGSNDERINLYNISIAPPSLSRSSRDVPIIPSLSNVPVASNSRNRELGSLLHHNGAITSLYFPTHSKLLSAAEDNNIAVARTKDGIVLTTIKAPVPKPIGRPSGDTAGPGEVPAGVNDFAVHPSMKLMLTVGKGERCMRLWNLVTGKKAGVLNFERDTLQQVGEGKYGTGEGRRIIWDSTGEEFVVAFERGAVVYDIDCKPRAKIVPIPATKVHQLAYVPGSEENILAVSTEDGRILFYDTKGSEAEAANGVSTNGDKATKGKPIPDASLVAQLGGRAVDISTRIKDFEILAVGEQESSTEIEGAFSYVIPTASSDGTIRLWSLLPEELHVEKESPAEGVTTPVPQVGQILAKYETGNRITCLKAFVMVGSGDDDGADTEGEAEKTEAESSDEDSD